MIMELIKTKEGQGQIQILYFLALFKPDKLIEFEIFETHDGIYKWNYDFMIVEIM